MSDENKGLLDQTEVVSDKYSLETLEFSDVIIYNEMADQTSVKLNLIEQIHSQIDQLEQLSHKRRFMMKEILQYID